MIAWRLLSGAAGKQSVPSAGTLAHSFVAYNFYCRLSKERKKSQASKLEGPECDRQIRGGSGTPQQRKAWLRAKTKTDESND
jgi:hypothetical protein